MIYRIHKILNNNAVLSSDENGNEIIITGNGVGFGMHVGGSVLEKKNNRIYVPQSKGFLHRFSSLMNDIPYECFDEAENIKEMAEAQLHQELNQNLIIALADHISFAISQYKEGEHSRVLINEEIERIYPEEFKAGKNSVKMVEKRFGVKCVPAEAGAFAFHIVNAEMTGKSDDVTKIMQSIQDIMEIIRHTMNINIQEDSMDYSRMIIHLKFFLKRVITGNTHDGEEFGQLLLNPNEGAFAGITQCLNEIGIYMKNTYDYDMTETERVYLLIHIARIVQSQKD